MFSAVSNLGNFSQHDWASSIMVLTLSNMLIKQPVHCSLLDVEYNLGYKQSFTTLHVLVCI